MDHSVLTFVLFIVCFTVIFDNRPPHEPILQSNDRGAQIALYSFDVVRDLTLYRGHTWAFSFFCSGKQDKLNYV